MKGSHHQMALWLLGKCDCMCVSLTLIHLAAYVSSHALAYVYHNKATCTMVIFPTSYTVRVLWEGKICGWFQSKCVMDFRGLYGGANISDFSSKWF